VVEARPTPNNSRLWSQVLQPEHSAAMVTTPLSDKGLSSAALLLAEASRTWGVSPWELALTFEV